MKKLILIFLLIFISIGTSLLSAQRDCLKQAELDALGRTMRPEKDTFSISPSGHFYIHFDTTGNAAPDLMDSDGNGVPDFVDEVGIIADSAHHVLVDIMEYEEEPYDGEGGYDIYIMSYGAGVYGYNYKDIGNTSYLNIDNDYVGYNSKFDLAPIEIMQISVAHEYFHGIQWGYEENLGSNAYFYEMTSMWFEDILIPDGNDYLDGWADDLLDDPTADFDNTGSGYELALFGHYLSSFLDSKGIDTAKNSTIIKEMWERYGSTNNNAFNSVKYVLENGYNISFIETWTDFMSRNLYNGIYENMDNSFYYYIDQSIVDPIITSTTLLSDSAEFVLELDDESAAIESFRIGSMESQITIDHDVDAFTGRVAIVSSNKPELNNLFWGSDTTVEESFNNVEVHFVYGIDGSSITLPIEITIQTVPLQYLIICPNRFESAAQELADMHSDSVDVDFRLKTEVVLVEDIATDATNYEIREYIITKMMDNSNLKFLLLFGDEIDIPPIFYNGDYPSDDFYTTPDDNNIFSGDPQLSSGRIPVSNETDAWTIVEKIKNYTLRPTSGIWRSKVALVADDMYKSCSYDSNEDSHTLSSDSLYDALSTLLPIQPFYGVHYGLQQTSSGCAYPDLTEDLIRTINNGVGLINYIGHGDPETWAGEKLISKSRDLPLIQVDDNKLAIWIAGTSWFGKYNGENSFMEALLFKEDGAIALVATTDEIGYTTNSNYLNNIFGLTDSQGIQQFINGNSPVRLGELVLNAKNGSFHKFHTFGDPALRLPFPTISDNIVETPPNSIKLVVEQILSVSSSGNNSTLLIRGNETELAFGDDSLLYTIPGVTYAQMNSDNNEICFRIPIDAGSCDDCATIHMYQDDNGFDGEIQFISDISILESEASSNDETGPDIYVSQNGSPIIEGSAIIPGVDLTISLNDSSGINLMETIGHGIRYAFDDDDLTLIPGDEFIYESCSEGTVQIPVNLGNSPGKIHFYLEVWDGVNNRSTIDLNFDLLDTPQTKQLLLSKVYPFPNPFSQGTHFTMFVSDTPANITITVYSLLGAKVIELPEYITEESFITIPWDGKSESGSTIANGAYFYHVKAEKDGKSVFEDIFKLAKVE